MADSDSLLTRARRAARAFRGDQQGAAPTPASEPRQDAVNSAGGSRSGASILNALSGVGDVRDSGAIARPNVDRQYLTTSELVTMLRGGIYRRVCMLHPWEGTRKGITLQDDTDEALPLATPMRDLKVLSRVRQASFLARALSESRIWLVVDDGQPQHKPLRIDRVRKVLGLHVLDVEEFSPERYQGNPRTASQLGWPETYHVHPTRPGVDSGISKTVHHTRLLPFIGDELPPSYYGTGGGPGYGFADAVGQTIWDSLRNLSQTSQAGARLAQELSVFVLYMQDMPGRDSEKRSLFRAALRTLMQVKSVSNGLVLGPNDRAERLTATASGFKDLSEDGWQHLQAVTGIPAPLLRMSTPGGLNTDGQSWQTGWYGSTVPAFQDEHLRDPLEIIIQCLYMATLGAIPETWSLTFNPLQEPTPIERAQVYFNVLQADRIALEEGGVTRDQWRRSRFGEGATDFSLGIQPPTEEDEEELAFGAGEMNLEEAEAQLQKLEGLRQPEASSPEAAEPSERLNEAQLKSAQEMLGAVTAGTLTAEAAELLLGEVVDPAKAAELVRAQRGAKPGPERPAPPRQDVRHTSLEGLVPDVLLARLDAGEMTWDEAVSALDAELPAAVARMRFKVPAFMQRNAELGMELRERFGRGMPAPEGGGPATGAETASDLKSGEIGAARVLLMAAWFARHFAPEQLKAKRQAEGWQDLEDPSNGWIASLGWGDKGDGRAKAWVERQEKKVREAIEAAGEREDADFTGKALISARLSAKGVERWRELLRQVEPITGRLQGYDPDDDGIQEAPHVTVLYLGAIDPDDLTEVAEVMREEASRFEPEALRLRRIATLPSGPVSGARTPVVAKVRCWALDSLHHSLLRRLAHLVNARQFPTYEQHVTLGFAPEMDGDQLVALTELVSHDEVVLQTPDDPQFPEPLGAIGEVVLTMGGEVVARAPFLGRYDSKPEQDRREDEAPVGNEVAPGDRGSGEE